MKFSEIISLFTPRVIGMFILVILGAIAIAIACGRAIKAMNRMATGWKRLTERFPARGYYKLGAKYESQTGFFGAIIGNNFSAYSRMFLIELAQEGFLVTANFARTPILIPWPAIREILETEMFGMGTYIQLTVDYEKILKFTIPKEALFDIKEHIPAERLHQNQIAFSDLLKRSLGKSPN